MKRSVTGRRSRTRRLAAGAAILAGAAVVAVPAAAAGSHRPAVPNRAILLAWGDNLRGQLGNSATKSSTVPVPVSLPAGTRVTSVRAGSAHTLALTASGNVLAWGYDAQGQLGNGVIAVTSPPVKVRLPAGTKVSAIQAGYAHSLALTTAGQVLAWGDNGFGQLGDGTTTSSTIPVRVMLPPGTKVAAITAASSWSMALTTDGRVLAWGDNSHGQFGDGKSGGFSDVPVRVRLPAGVTVTSVSADAYTGLALTAAGRVLAWGNNRYGQIGDGTMISRTRPVAVRLPQGTKVRSLAGGCWSSLALTATGRVLAWGLNGNAQLGDATTTNRRRPVRVKISSGTKVTAISAGCSYGLARTAVGRVLAWGFGGAGELGNGRTSDSPVPVRVRLPAGLTAYAIGTGPAADFGFALVRRVTP